MNLTQLPVANRSQGSSLPRASVLDCGSPLPLSQRSLHQSAQPKRQRTGSLQNLAALLTLIFLSPFFCQLAPAAAPTDAEIRDAYHKSYRYEKAQNYADAIKALAPVITAYPQAYTVNLRLGWLNYLTGSFATARTHYQAAIKAAPDSLEAKLGHTLPLLAQEKWEDVELLTKQILRVDPANYTANLRLAYASRLQKKFDAAEAILNGMLVLYPTDISLLTELALVKLAKDNKAEAKRLFNDIVILDPENVTAKAQLSKL